ncbi:MAG: hypothetical protein WDN44_13815 [Sphingomonas sp.]
MKALFTDEAETRGITVRVSVSYLPEQSEPARGRWFWAYHIRIENEGADDGPAPHPPLDDHRRARPSPFGRGRGGWSASSR